MSRRYQTARCILFRDRTAAEAAASPPEPVARHSTDAPREFLLAMHGSMWGRRRKRWGLPGGRVEWREDPTAAALRELHEELQIRVETPLEVGDFRYKHRWHKVLGAPWSKNIERFDKLELLALRWFSLEEVVALERERRLHAGYEREAIEHLLRHLPDRCAGQHAS